MLEKGSENPKQETIESIPGENIFVSAIRHAVNEGGMTLDQALAKFRADARATGPHDLPNIDQAENFIRAYLEAKKKKA